MVYYTGDIHGNAKAIVAFAQYFELTESDTIVILGDVGANYIRQQAGSVLQRCACQNKANRLLYSRKPRTASRHSHGL